MLEIAAHVLACAGTQAALATVIDVEGSAPHPAGTSMLVTAGGAVVGSVSGGCVEGAVLETAAEVVRTGRAARVRYGISDDAAYGLGLTCGGQIEVLLAPVPADPVTRAALEAAAGGGRAGTAVVAGPEPLRGLAVPLADGAPWASQGPGLGADGLGRARPDPLARARAATAVLAPDHPAAGILTEAHLASLGGADLGRVAAEARAAVDAGRTGLVNVECGAETLELFCESVVPPARFVVCGANQYAVALAEAAAWAGYAVTVVDARPAFATPDRFPAAEVVRAWPHDFLAGADVDERTVLCVLTHDPKFDVPLLRAALTRPLAYVGAMGSRRTHEERVAALRDAGVGPRELDRLHSPIGLDLGASTPQETALAILAEVVAARTGASGAELRHLTGPVHRR